MAYTITFKPLRSANTTYILSIGGGTGSIALKGAAQPFTTQEDDNDDQFTPLRTQSGYIRIVDDGKDVNGNSLGNDWWKSLVPETDTDRPITLSKIVNNVSTIVWQGFMQAQNFSGTLYGNPQEREFPIQCPLAALSASDVDATNRELKNFAYIIKQAFDNIVNAGIVIRNYVFQGGSIAQSWLLMLIDWQNFISNTDDGLEGKYDNQRIIQDVCSYWGWTCRVNGQDVIFSCADDNVALPGVLVLTQAQLNSMAEGTASGTTTGTFLSALSLGGDIFSSKNQGDFRVRGYSKAVVTADGSPAEKEIIGFAPESVEKLMKGRTSYVIQDGDSFVYYTEDLTSFTSDYIDGSCRSGYASFNLTQIRKTRQESNADILDTIKILKSYSSSSAQAYASLVTKFHHSYYDEGSSTDMFNNGGLFLKGKIYRKANQYDDHADNNESWGNKTMYMRVGVGKDRNHCKWWTGSAWSSTVSSFMVAIGNLDDSLYIKTTNGQTVSHSINIPTNELNLTGLVFVEFLGSDDMPEDSGQRSFDIHDFSIEFVRSTMRYEITGGGTSANGGRNFGGTKKYRVIEREGSREYVAKNESKVRQPWNADVIYAADNDMEFGYGVILNPNGSQIGKQSYGTNQEWPEQHLANRVAAYWSTAKRKLQLELRTDLVPVITPRNTVTVDGTTFYPISIGNDFWNDITMLTLLEI